jgi:hypothetical protein
MEFGPLTQPEGQVTGPCKLPARGVRVRPSQGRTDEASQIYGRADYCVLREHEAGAKTDTQARRLGSDALQLEGQIRRHGCFRGQASEAAREQERQVKEAVGGADAGCGRTSRASGKLGPAAKREGVAHLHPDGVKSAKTLIAAG